MPRSSPACCLATSPSVPALTLALWAAVACTSLADESNLERRRGRAIELEKRGAWIEACRSWDDILRRDRHNLFARDGYQRCLRRLHLVLRHSDAAYRQTLVRLTPPQALDTYEQILTILQVGYPDRSRTTFAQLFHQGLQEVRIALDDPFFREHYLAGLKPAALQSYRDRLAAWPAKRITTRTEAREQVLAVLRSASREGLTFRPAALSALTLEFAAGACNTLDEHSAFVSPGNLALIQAALRGKHVGIGAELGLADDQLQITRVLPKSPAEEVGLLPGDRLLRINGQPVHDLPVETAADRLRGEAGSLLEIEVEVTRDGFPERRLLKLARRAVASPSVDYNLLAPLEYGQHIGYIKIHHFVDSTPQEMKEALLALSSSMEPIKGLILDLRGNPGGVFKSAVAVAELFVADGVLVIGQSGFKEYNRPFKAEAGTPLQLPLVVLIDGDTASAAEVLAGAMQGGRPATRLLGQTTFGKGSIQCVIPVEKAPTDRLAGIRLTVARLLSPTNQPYTGRGVIPDVPREEKGEALLPEARRQLLDLMRAGLPMPMGTPRMMDATTLSPS
ncbi:MAG: S41 family peptidase [Gemmataceae bacterium]